jgi:predicted N-acetyltransferase YhbS
MFELRLVTAADLPALHVLIPASVRALGAGSRILAACAEAARAAGFAQLELVATLPGEPLYRALGFAARERYEVPLPGGLGLPVLRMVRASSSATAAGGEG